MERYLVTMQFYVNEPNDKNAITAASHFKLLIDAKYDNKAQIISIETAPFGKIGQNRKVKL